MKANLSLRGKGKGATKGAKEDKVPPLSKSKLRKKIKYCIVLILFVSQ